MSCGDAGGDPGGFFFSWVFVNMGDDLGRGLTPAGVRPRPCSSPPQQGAGNMYIEEIDHGTHHKSRDDCADADH